MIGSSEIADFQKAIRDLSTVCDGAVTLDGMGFNGTDSHFGKSLASQSIWTDKQAQAAKEMLRKYRKQLEAMGHHLNFDAPIKNRATQFKSEVPFTLEIVTRAGTDALLIRCPFERNADVKQVKGCRFDKEAKGWIFPLTLQTMSALLSLSGLQATAEVKDRHRKEEEKISELLQIRDLTDTDLSDLPQSHLLYPYQRVGVKFLAQARRAILGDDMGLGKTPQAIIASRYLKHERMLIICPNTLKANWKREIQKWWPGVNVTVINGNRQKKKEIVQNVETGFLIVNFELVRPAHGLTDSLQSIKWDLVIIDEAHGIKNRKADQTKGVRQLTAQVPNVWLLSGTIVMNKVDELWSPLNVLDPKRYSSFWDFVRNHAQVYQDRYGWKIIPEPTNPARLRAEIAPFYLRRETSEVRNDIPPVSYQEVWVSLKDEQRRLYDEMEAEAITKIGDNLVAAPIVLAQITRLRQIAISQEILGGEETGAKIRALVDMAQGTNRKIVVFSQFAKALHIAAKHLKEADITCTVMTGETPEPTRDVMIQDFQNNPETKVFLTTIQAGGQGISLTAASIGVFLDKNWTPAQNLQAVKRLARHGQKDPVIILEIMAENTVEEWIDDLLESKTNIVESIIGRLHNKYKKEE